MAQVCPRCVREGQQAAAVLSALEEIRATAAKIGVMPLRRLPGATDRADVALTPRERDILVGMAAGKEYVEIGRDLHIALSTVNSHVNSLFRKLGARGQGHAVHLGWQYGYLRAVGLDEGGCE